MFDSTTHACISSITRNDKVEIYYKDNDTHGFACSYLFYKYFQKYEMLGNISFIKTDYLMPDTITKGAIVILIDMDINYLIGVVAASLAKKMVIIDVKESVINSLLKDNKHNLPNTSFFHHSGLSPIGVVWKLLDESSIPPEVLNCLNLSYCSEHSFLEASNKIAAIRSFLKTYEVWDKLIDDKEIEEITTSELINTLNRNRAISICARNGEAMSISGYKVICINCSREDMDEVGVIASLTPDCDFALVYEKVKDHYFYKAYRRKDKDINLLDVFKHTFCSGFKNRMWFRLEKEITSFKQKRSILSRLIRSSK